MRAAWACAAVGLALGAGRAQPVELEQVLSREAPAFRVDSARLAVGRDGQVYLCSGGNKSFVLRLGRDGAAKFGAAVEYAAGNATANGDGVVATANGHFARKVTVYGADFARRGAAGEFLANDQVGWDAPAHVEAGAGGDFYALDQHRDRVVKVSASGKALQAYPVARKPAGHPGLMQDFRVCEQRQAFYILRRSGPLQCVGFDGVERWTYAAGVSWGSPGAGGFDVDDEGHLYVIDRHGEAVRKVSPGGKPAATIKLQAGRLRPGHGEHGWTDLRVHGGDLLLKRRHPTELFQRYDLATGAFRQAVSIDHERLTATFPQRVWTAGQEVPFDVQLSGAQGAAPRWRVWARPLDCLDYREFALAGGKLRVPADCAGLYQVKVTPELKPWLRGQPPAYGVRGWVDIRSPGAKGSATVWCERHRDHFGRGEEVRCLVQVRGPDLAGAVPVTLRLADGERALAEQRLTVTAGAEPRPVALSASLTAALRPGRYLLTAIAPGMTCVPLPLVIGPGVTRRPFHLVQYGDYGPLYPSADAWDAPDVTAAHVARTAKLGMNLIVDRLGEPTQMGALKPDPRSREEVGEVLKHLDADPAAPAPGRYAATPALGRTLSGYSAAGVEQMAILMMNDAGLPLGGPGFDPRKPPQLLEAIARVTDEVKPYPSFRGWVWGSNWWVFSQRGARAAAPEERSSYEAALKRAKQDGTWDPVLERVSSRRLSWAVEAQALFNKRLKEIAPGLVTASAAPHRNVEAYPPVSLGNVDEVDLQAQWEQVPLPYHTPHGIDFYRRPGKRAFAHPEVWNDSGTGDQILPSLFQAVMRGADGVGCSGPVPPWTRDANLRDDPRVGHYGTASVFRALNDTLRPYGPWLATLEGGDRVAIVVSGRMLRIDEWGPVMGTHFARLFEAYMACLHAHHPASYVFVEDLKPGALDRYKAVLVVGQTVEMEPELLQALQAAKAAGVAVLHDGTCRASLVKGFTPLGVAFNRFEKDTHPAGDDDAFLRFPAYCKAHVLGLRRALGKVAAAPAAEVENPEVFLSERTSGEGRYLFVVNNTTADLEPGHLWRITLAVANRVPTAAAVRLGGNPGAVYDVFAGAKVEPKGGAVQADLRSLPARLYALLPRAIDQVALKGPEAVRAGQEFAWSVGVNDAAGRPIAAGVPVRVRLLAAGGEVLDEQFTSSGSKGTTGSMRVPLNAPVDLRLEATELFSGKSGVLGVRAQQTAGPADLTGAAKAPVGEASSAGKPGRSPWTPAEARFGPHVRDMVVTDSGSLAVLNTMNWDHNLYGLDVETGAVRWRQRAGQYFAFDPRPLTRGAAVQGFDFESAEGYHLYLVGADGTPERRFALYGLPRRQIHRFVPGILTQHINHFATPPDGRWVASAGDLGLAVWSRDGRLLWSRDWWKKDRHTAVLAALGDDTLLIAEGAAAAAVDAATGKELWQVPLAKAGEVRRARVSGDGKTAALLCTAEGGRVFVLRGGKLIAALPTGGNDLAVSPDGARVAVVDANHLKVYSAEGGLLWSLPGDDTLLNPRFAPDGGRVAAGSALGTAYVVGADGEVFLERDLERCRSRPGFPAATCCWRRGWGRCAGWTRSMPSGRRVRLGPAQADMRGKLLARDRVPTTRVATWGNASPAPRPLKDNLLSPRTAQVKFESAMPHVKLAHPAGSLVDGKPEPPPSPWLRWPDLGYVAEPVADQRRRDRHLPHPPAGDRRHPGRGPQAPGVVAARRVVRVLGRGRGEVGGRTAVAVQRRHAHAPAGPAGGGGPLPDRPAARGVRQPAAGRDRAARQEAGPVPPRRGRPAAGGGAVRRGRRPERRLRLAPASLPPGRGALRRELPGPGQGRRGLPAVPAAVRPRAAELGLRGRAEAGAGPVPLLAVRLEGDVAPDEGDHAPGGRDPLRGPGRGPLRRVQARRRRQAEEGERDRPVGLAGGACRSVGRVPPADPRPVAAPELPRRRGGLRPGRARPDAGGPAQGRQPLAGKVARSAYARDLRLHRRRGRRPHPRPELDAQLRLGGVPCRQDAGRHVHREPGVAARRPGRPEDDGVVGDAAGGVGGLPPGAARPGSGDAGVCHLAGRAAGQAGVRRLPGRLRLPVRLLVPDPLRRPVAVLALGPGRQDVRDGAPGRRVPRLDEAQHAETLVRRPAAHPRRAGRRRRPGGAVLQHARGARRGAAALRGSCRVG
ncbi:MAG: PQQ-binding-like beta-propeller repeat protein [Gemmataceae bacterium]